MKSKKLVACLALALFMVITILGLHACGTQNNNLHADKNLPYPIAALTAYADHPELAELSGIVKSKTYQNVYWVHNDSGDKPRIFAINRAAEVLVPPESNLLDAEKPWQGVMINGAKNRDWEDIAIYDGKIYLADMGNNRNARVDLGIYIFDEPHPLRDTSANSATFISVRYPDQLKFPATEWHFDNEAFFIDDGSLYFLSKHRKGPYSFTMAAGTKLYRLDSLHTDIQNTLTLVGTHPEITAATGADLSPNGRKLAILTYTKVWIFEKPTDNKNWLEGKMGAVATSLNQAEAITWIDDDTLLITNEQRQVFELNISELILK